MSVRSDLILRKRVLRYFNEEFVAAERRSKQPRRNVTKSNAEQMQFEFSLDSSRTDGFVTHKNNIVELMDVLCRTVPEGGVYLFGGMLRDLALIGKQGFNSDIDIVIDGDWGDACKLLIGMGAKRNKFGGLRLRHEHKNFPIDIWSAKDTWAIREGYVKYDGIASLLNTTVLNWDAILMNWKTKSFIYKPGYYDDINDGFIDIVLEFNPNPLSMFVRILRHILLKDAKKVSFSVTKYLNKYAMEYEFEQIKAAEYSSYGNNHIHKKIFESFREQSIIINTEHSGDGIGVEDVINPTIRMAI